ncbi:unnamed protein product, partial [Cyprideis torosa]
MVVKRAGRTNKNPPVFSHEFVIQNHADIVSCVAMVVVVGLMFQVSSPIASIFVAVQHNLTDPTASSPRDEPPLVMTYGYGTKDMAAIFFYTLTVIIAHAVLQEYCLDVS